MNWKRLLIPNIQKIIGLIIFFLFIFVSGGTIMDAVILGTPYTFYSASKALVRFSIINLILDILIAYILLCIVFYYPILKIKEKETKTKNLFKHIGNFIMGMAIFLVLMFLVWLFLDYISMRIRLG
jgi:DMSO reductase anchor subunit